MKMRTHPLHPNLVLTVACAVAIGLFLLGIAVPQAHLWGSFLLPVVLIFLWGRRRDIYIVTVLASVLVLAEYLADGATSLADLLVNHLAPIFILWVVAWLLDTRRQLQEQRARREQELDVQVTARTAALTAREEQLAKIFNANPGGIAITRQSDGCFLEANDAYLAMVGYTREQLVGRSLVDLGIMSAAARDQVRAVFRETGAIRGLDLQLTNAHGAPVDILYSLEQIDFEGEPCYLGLVFDVTERNRLAAYNGRLAAIVAASHEAIISADLAGTIVSVNHSAEELYGVSAAKVVGRSVADVAMPQNTAGFQELLARIGAGEVVTVDDATWQLPDGTTRFLAISISPIRDGAGQVTAFTAFARDVSARKAAERERIFLSALVASSPEAVVGRAVDGTILSWNRGAEQLFGYTAEEAIGQNLTMLAAPDSRAQMEAVMAEVAQGNAVEGVETQRVAKDGRILDCQISSFPVRDGAGEILGVASFTHDISQRRAAEHALRASEERFARLFNASPVGLALTRLADGLFREVNAAFAAMIGYSREEMIGRTSAELGIISTADRARLAAALQEQGSFRGTDIVLRARGGELLNTIFSIDLMDFDGDSWMLSSIVNITERKQLEDALRDSEERFRLIVQNSPDIIALYNEVGELTYISPIIEATHGFTAEQALAVDPLLVEAIVTPSGEGPRAEELARIRALPRFADRHKTAETVAYCLDHPGIQQRVEICSTLPSGEVRYFDAAYRAHLRAGGSRQVVSITRDITERVQAERQMSEALQRLRLAKEAAKIGIWNWNFADDRLEWDDRMYELYAVPAEQRRAGITHDLWRACIHPDDLAQAEPAQGDPGRLGSQWTVIFRVVLPGGGVRYIEASSVTDYDNSGRPWRMIGINRDITDQKLYEELLHDTTIVLERRVAERTVDLQAAFADLQRAGQIKDEFLAMISHELRTPLTGVLSMSEMLEEQIAGPLNDRQVYYVKGIIQSGERLLNVLNGILGYTHLISGKVKLQAEPCELAYLLAVCAASQQHKAAEKHQSIAVRVAPPDLAITSDATALAEVLKRMLDNAVKFTPEGGQIGLEAKPGTAPNTADLVVWDTGIGIAADQHEHVFHAFAQADSRLQRSHEGIGMGLAYVDEMVRLLGGTVALESAPGQGSRFTITLPAQGER